MFSFRYAPILLLSGLMAGCSSTPDTSSSKHSADNSVKARLERAEKQYPSAARVNEKIARQLDLLESGDAQKRAWAAYTIGKMRVVSSKAIHHLIAMLGDDEQTTMDRYVGNSFNTSMVTTPGDEAAKSLARIGKPAVKPLLVELNSKSQFVQLKTIKALALIKPASAIKLLVKKLATHDPKVRLAAANALGKYRGPWVADALLVSLTHNNEKVRASAAYSLGNIRDPLAFKALVKRLDDASLAVQIQAINAIVKYGYDAAIPVLLKKLGTPGNTDIAELIYSLGSLRDYRVIEALIPLTESGQQVVRNAAVDSLQQISGQNFGFDKNRWQTWWDKKLARARQGKR